MSGKVFLFVGLLLTNLSGPDNYQDIQSVNLDGLGRIEVRGRLGYLRDVDRKLTIEDVKDMTFTPTNSESSPNIAFDRSAHWFKINITNKLETTEWLLEVAYAPLDQIDFYEQNSDGSFTHKVSGDHYPIADRDLQHRHPIFAFEIQQAELKTIYLRVQSISSVQVPVTFWNRNAFLKTSYKVQLFNGLFYGAMILMILYQLFLFFSIRDKITIYYVLTLLTMVNVVAFFQGYSFLYTYPRYPQFNDILAMVTGPLFVVCSTLLTRAFLNVRYFSKLLDNLLLGNMFADLAVVVIMTIFFRQISFQYHNYLIFLHCLIALICAGYCFYKKYRPARYYLIAWFTLLVAAGIFTISSVGFMPGHLSTNYTGLMAGCVLQMLFISFALGDRWRTLEKENRRAKELEFRREQEEKERLENEVQLRTNEIKKQNLQLEEVNHVKDKLFSVVSHDIKGPLSSLHLALTLAKSGALSSEEFQELTASLELRLSQTSEFIDNLLQWAKLQMKGETFDPDKLDVSALARESVRLLEPECVHKKITLKNNLQGSFSAYADLNMMRSVIRNLLTNAIKFTKPNGTITINAYRVDAKIIISVADTGVGIPTKNRERLFTLTSITTEGTHNEKGTGLGLLLCREFVEKNGGKIWVESEPGKGTTFFFSIPVYVDGVMAAANGKG
jgi:signal transduction histidine kinase